MELNSQKKLVAHICRLLKVTEIVFPIGRTNKGNLGLKFQAGQEDFDIMLDAVPLSTKDMLVDDNNIELKGILEKYLFTPDTVNYGRDASSKAVTEVSRQFLQKDLVNEILEDKAIVDMSSHFVQAKEKFLIEKGLKVPSKKRGRPSGSKNKAK